MADKKNMEIVKKYLLAKHILHTIESDKIKVSAKIPKYYKN